MKKIIKMSLVAAVAVAGLSTTAAAEDTKFSGKLYVEHHTSTSDKSGDSTDGESKSGFEIDFDITGKKKISDTLTAVVGIEADSDKNDQDYTANTGTEKAVILDDAHFVYAKDAVAVKFGRQGMGTPTTDGELGEGVLASYTMGDITAVGAHFSNTHAKFGNATAMTGNSAYALALLGTAGPVNFELWDVDVSSHSTNLTAVVSAKVAGWTLGLRHATTDYRNDDPDGVTTIVSVAGKAGKLGLTALMVQTDKDGGAFTTDKSSKNAAELTYFASKDLEDATAFVVIASMPFTDTVSGTVKYGTASFDQDGSSSDKASEIVGQVNYKLAKSTTLTGRYSMYTEDIGGVDTDKSQARVDLTYKF